MRARPPIPFVRSLATLAPLALVVVAACVHEERRPVAATRPTPRASSPVPSAPPQYVVADPGPRTNVVAVALGGAGGVGLVIDRARIVTGRGNPRVSVDAPDAAITGAARIPGRLGGGFLFWTNDTLFRADSFDGTLKPIARMPDSVQLISFAPKYVLVRTHNGERWGFSLPSGERAAIEPLGVVDVEGLDDGRALAFNDEGAAFTSVDSGAHWMDVTSQIRSSPSRCAVIDDDLWLIESSGAAERLEPDGHLSWFDKPPPEKPVELRARDPRWHGSDAPLREVFRGGAVLDENTSLVVAEGDLVRVDVRSGDITSVQPGKAPPDATCDAVTGGGDLLFACVKRSVGPSGQPEAFVLSHVLSDEPVIEQTFTGVTSFYASDDGGLAVAGPCAGGAATPSSSVASACVRQPGGTWLDVDVSALAADGGPGDVNVARWVPRADGRAVAIVASPDPGVYDPRSGSLQTWGSDARDVVAEGGGGLVRYRFGLKKRYRAPDTKVVDSSWTMAPDGTLRAWQPHGGAVAIADGGKITRSPYSLDVVGAGPNGVGRTTDGRLYQSLDHGVSWTEVAAPPSGASALELRSCSAAGCDLGGFYRVGWAPRAPRVEPAQAPVRAASEVRRTKAVEVTCRPSGPAQGKALGRTDRSPDDLGLGMNRLAVSNDSGDLTYLRVPTPKGIQNPIHDSSPSDDSPALRGLLSGYQTQRDADVITVMGPNKSASSLRRSVAYVSPFEPASPVHRASIAMSDVLTAGHAAGMTTEEVLSDDMTETLNFIAMTPTDPGAPGDLVLHNPRGLVAWLKGDRVRVGVRQVQNDATVIAGVSLPGDEAAFLEVESSGVGHVFKLTSGIITDLFDVDPTMNDTSFYPANPDTLAIGPKGDLAILRTSSGSDPASALDPALLLVPAMPAVALAPWSTLRMADDPACKGDPGWRATIQVIAPWLRVSTPALKVDDAPMIARVKWNERRVCLEGVEVRLPPASVRASHDGSSDNVSVSTWLVARGSTFARVGIGEGMEWRQPLECTLSPPAPVGGVRP
jgi:hypothetical protein